MSPKPVREGPKGRPEFITFDTPYGLAVVPVENIAAISPTPDLSVEPTEENATPEPKYGIAFHIKGTDNSMVCGNLSLVIARYITTHIVRSFTLGPIQRGMILDIDTLAANIMAAMRQQAEQMKSQIIDPATGEPATTDGPRLVVPEAETVAATEGA